MIARGPRSILFNVLEYSYVNAQVSESSAPGAAAATARFIKIGEDGALLPPDASEWVAVLDTKQNLMWDAKARPVKNYTGALKVPGKLAVAGFKDWRLPSVEELFLLADRARCNPAIDTDFFPKTPSVWFWTSTLAASSPSGYAWYVLFGYGGSLWHYQNLEGFVRAVRPGQSI